jgi:ABC-2 type transport system ATP-binding protein
LFDGELATTFFPSRVSAGSRLARQQGSYTLRRINLEEVFISMTGKKVEQ